MKSFLYSCAAFALFVASGVMLSGCVSLGLSQQQSETAYTVAAIASDVFIGSGKATGDVAGQICLADNASYKILIATRNVADGVNYAPADNAHAQLHADGAKLNPSCALAP